MENKRGMWHTGRDSEGWRLYNGAVVEGGIGCGLEMWKMPQEWR